VQFAINDRWKLILSVSPLRWGLRASKLSEGVYAGLLGCIFWVLLGTTGRFFAED
jgi:hypothetical protein